MSTKPDAVRAAQSTTRCAACDKPAISKMVNGVRSFPHCPCGSTTFNMQIGGAALAEQPAEPTRSQKLANAGFTRRPTLRALEMRSALELVAAPMRPDGTWNRDREACRQLAAEALGRWDDASAAPHPAPSVAVPDDWQLVPKVPTDIMLADYLAANAAYWRNVDTLPPTPGVWRNGTPKEATAAGYRAMLAASPQPPTRQDAISLERKETAWHAKRWAGLEAELRQARAALDSQAAELAEAVEANSMKDIELARLRTENANLKTVMVAAAEEIAAHWNAHCDSEGYGPQNLMRRLEEGIPSEYGYTAGRFAEIQAELAALRASAASVQADQRAELDRLLAEHAATIKLATFGAWAAREFRDTLSDVDGGSAQEAMERFGVIEMHQVTEPCGEGCVCAEYDFPCDCYRFPPAISEAMDAALAAKGEGA